MRIFISIIMLVMIITANMPLFAGDAESVINSYSADTTNHYLSQKRNKAPLASEILPSLPAYQRQFVEDYVKVKRFQDDVLLKELVHPASRACENATNTDYYDYLRYFYLNEELPEVFRLQIMEIAPSKQKDLQQRLQFPAIPTHVMFIEYGEGQNIEGLQRFLREETVPSKKLYELVKCPDDETLQQFRQQMRSAQ